MGLQELVEALHQADRSIVLDEDDSKFLDQASCFEKRDEVFIKDTIKTRLGGQDQVTLIVKERLRAAMDIRVAEREPQSDREALTLFFRQSDGPNWKNREQWLEKEAKLSAWHGVETGGGSNDKVTTLSLKELGIATVAASIGYLRSLTKMDLSGNVMEGLPNTIGGLGQLQTLDLSGGEKLTALPSTLYKLPLKKLDIGYCKKLPLDTVEHICQHLTQLEELDLRGLEITELPNTIGQLGSLQILNLSYCSKLTELPNTIGQLGSLQRLDLQWCEKLTGSTAKHPLQAAAQEA